jgi:hypothetical protein
MMRNLLLAGTAGLLVTLGAAGAGNAAQPNPNVPSWSPYAIGAYEGAPQTSSRLPAHRMMSEGRAAYVKPAHQNQIFSDGSSDGDHMIAPDRGNADYSKVPGGLPFGAPYPADR